jgi:hypothetical protein
MVGPCRPGAWIWREGRIVRVGDLDPAAFPERRDLAAVYEKRGRILEADDISSVANFVHERIA